MKFNDESTDKIVLNASKLKTSTRENKPKGASSITHTTSSEQNVMKNIPFTLFTSRGRR